MRWLLVWVGVWAGAAQAQICAPVPVNTCARAGRVSVAIAGDVLVHEALATRGYLRGFSSLWSEAERVLRAADLAVVNLEGPVAVGFARGGRRVVDPGPVFDDIVYTDYPTFNYHPMLIGALRAAGVDVVTTANNHALDRGAAGLDATLSALDEAGLRHVGAVRGGEVRWQPLRLQTSAGPMSLIACTYGTNGIPDPRGQVPRCYEDRRSLLALVRTEAARGAGVLVLPHWGREYALDPDPLQRRLARDLIAAGAMAVVGAHPHVPQPWEMLEGADGTAPVLYSTGNFVAAQPPLERATGLIALLRVCRGARRPVIGEAGYVPIQMEFDGADPSLRVLVPGGSAREEAGRALLARLIPGREVSAACAPQPRFSVMPETPDR